MQENSPIHVDKDFYRNDHLSSKWRSFELSRLIQSHVKVFGSTFGVLFVSCLIGVEIGSIVLDSLGLPPLPLSSDTGLCHVNLTSSINSMLEGSCVRIEFVNVI